MQGAICVQGQQHGQMIAGDVLRTVKSVLSLSLLGQCSSSNLAGYGLLGRGVSALGVADVGLRAGGATTVYSLRTPTPYNVESR